MQENRKHAKDPSPRHSEEGRDDRRCVARLTAAALWGAVLLCRLIACATPASAAESLPAIAGLATVELADVTPPPEWALWERHLLDRFYASAVEFVQRYTREDGTLIWRDEWPGMDGSDDGYESFYNFPLYYALGGPEEIDAFARRLWDAVARQFTRYGQIHNEFDGYYDWMHHGEAYTNFYFFGLANPTVAKFRERSLRLRDCTWVRTPTRRTTTLSRN